MQQDNTHKLNCFDIIRHLAALTVMISHHRPFNGTAESMVRGFLSWGGIGVAVFFAISGFLVTPSFYRSGNFITFMERRVRRIFPGLIVCSFFLIYLVAPFYNSTAVFEYLLSPSTFKNFMSMSAMIPVHIPNVFETYKAVGPPNGSLWTLPIEFTCYLVLSFMLSIHKGFKSSAILFAASVIASFSFSDIARQSSFYSIQLFWLLQFGSCFFLGSLMHHTRKSWDTPKIKIFLVFISVLFLYVLGSTREIQVFGYISITLLTIIIGCSFRDILIKGRFDLSYGLYIYAWPIQQIMSNETNMNYWWSLVASIITVTALAALSWKFVEKPFLHKAKGKEVVPETDPASSNVGVVSGREGTS